jgi:hypothetical protein
MKEEYPDLREIAVSSPVFSLLAPQISVNCAFCYVVIYGDHISFIHIK